MSSLPPSSRATSAGLKVSPRPCLKHSITARSSPPQSTPPQPHTCPQSYSHSQPLTALDSSSTTPHSNSHVHFPPSQSLSTTFPTHSKKTYDRRPLVVAPNVCALPARGCPGRTYPSGAYMRRQSQSEIAPVEDDTDIDVNLDELLFSPPQWVDATPTMPTPQHNLPALISDHGVSSSESEESDALMSPQSHSNVAYFAYGSETQMGERQMDFLPHAPSWEKGRDREREREREIRRRRRREREEEERGRWKTSGTVFGRDDGSCLGGF